MGFWRQKVQEMWCRWADGGGSESAGRRRWRRESLSSCSFRSASVLKFPLKECKEVLWSNVLRERGRVKRWEWSEWGLPADWTFEHWWYFAIGDVLWFVGGVFHEGTDAFQMDDVAAAVFAVGYWIRRVKIILVGVQCTWSRAGVIRVFNCL